MSGNNGEKKTVYSTYHNKCWNKINVSFLSGELFTFHHMTQCMFRDVKMHRKVFSFPFCLSGKQDGMSVKKNYNRGNLFIISKAQGQGK